MSSMKSWMLGAAVVAAGLGLGATTAQAAEFGYHERGPAAWIPPCPGPGYFWIAGYQADGYWIPGRWEFRGDRDRGAFARFDYDRGWNRDRDRDRRWDRDRRDDRDRDWDRHHDRNRDHDRW